MELVFLVKLPKVSFTKAFAVTHLNFIVNEYAVDLVSSSINCNQAFALTLIINEIPCISVFIDVL